MADDPAPPGESNDPNAEAELAAHAIVVDESAESHRKDGSDALEELLKVLERVPFVGVLKRDAAVVRELLVQRRPVRVLAFGSAKSGRTRLLGGLMERSVASEWIAPGSWSRLNLHGRRLDWLELDADAAAPDALRKAWKEQPPDVVVLAVRPDEVEAGLGAVLEPLLNCQAELERGGDKKRDALTVLPVLTMIDGLPPESAAWPFPEEKRSRIQITSQRLAKQLKEARLRHERIFEVCTPSAAERRLGIDGAGLHELAVAIAEAAPADARVEAARVFPAARASRRRLADELVRSFSTLSITVALMPVPLSDVAIIAPLQAAMVMSVAYLSGRPWDAKSVTEVIASLGMVSGAGLGLRWGAQQLLKLVPGGGMFISGSIAGAGTLALGRSAIAYYLSQE